MDSGSMETPRRILRLSSSLPVNCRTMRAAGKIEAWAPKNIYISEAPCIWLDVKNLVQLVYNSTITRDSGPLNNDSDEKRVHKMGPRYTT